MSPADRKANAVFGLYVLAVGLIAAPLVHQSFRHAGHRTTLSAEAQARNAWSADTAHDERVPHSHPTPAERSQRSAEDSNGEPRGAAQHGHGDDSPTHREDRGGHAPLSSDDHGGAPHEHREGSTEHLNFVVAELTLEALTLLALTVDARLLVANECDGEATTHLLIAEPQGP